VNPSLPALPLDDWEPAKDTLHLWCQIIGKTKLALTSRRNHWWNVPLYVSSRGLTTRRLPLSARNLEIELDLVGHRLVARTTDGESGFDLVDGLSVAEFHTRFFAELRGLGVEASIWSVPFGVPMTTPFPEDHDHASYDPEASGRFLTALQWTGDVFEEFAGWSNVKTSPVHLFWHSLDLAVTRFSGRRAPAIPDADPVTAEAYSHEVVSCGFWAGDPETRFPAYYAYTAPEPEGIGESPLRPDSARWVGERGGLLAVLPYDTIRTSADPRGDLLAFLNSSFDAGAALGNWDVADHATAWSPTPNP